MSRIGILGGTFDPVHVGHLALATEALQALSLDRVIFMVTGTPHYKTDVRRVSSREARLKMTELSVSQNPAFTVSDLECRREGNTYTADTLEILKKEHPENSYVLLTGADAFLHMVHWKNVESVLKNAAVGVVLRMENGTDGSMTSVNQVKAELEEKYDARIQLFYMKPVPVSSTMVRECVRNKMDIRGLVTEETARFIEEAGLYREV